MLVVTGATGQLGRLVITELLRTVAAGGIIAAVRDTDKAADLADQGVIVRFADYNQPDSLRAAFTGASRVLLISSSEVGQRIAQHQAVIDAAKAEGVDLLAYTSILHAPSSSLGLAQEHLATEKALAVSGLSHVLLRNGWYSENYTAGIPIALEHGAVLGCSGDGKIATATRADYAAAAAAVLTGPDQAGRIYELAGDEAFTLSQFAAHIADLSGKPVVYQDLPQEEYAKVLEQAGLPTPIAQLLADSGAGAARDDLFDDSRQLSQLIGHSTTPIQASVKTVLNSLDK